MVLVILLVPLKLQMQSTRIRLSGGVTDIWEIVV
jgi:hypothetical protein